MTALLAGDIYEPRIGLEEGPRRFFEWAKVANA